MLGERSEGMLAQDSSVAEPGTSMLGPLVAKAGKVLEDPRLLSNHQPHTSAAYLFLSVSTPEQIKTVLHLLAPK